MISLESLQKKNFADRFHTESNQNKKNPSVSPNWKPTKTVQKFNEALWSSRRVFLCIIQQSKKKETEESSQTSCNFQMLNVVLFCNSQKSWPYWHRVVLEQNQNAFKQNCLRNGKYFQIQFNKTDFRTRNCNRS